MVPLISVADVVVNAVPNEITRQDGSRRIDVTFNARERDLGAVAREVQATLRASEISAVPPPLAVAGPLLGTAEGRGRDGEREGG
jgi:multidrug efflux pump subunit AcrB